MVWPRATVFLNAVRLLLVRLELVKLQLMWRGRRGRLELVRWRRVRRWVRLQLVQLLGMVGLELVQLRRGRRARQGVMVRGALRGQRGGREADVGHGAEGHRRGRGRMELRRRRRRDPCWVHHGLHSCPVSSDRGGVPWIPSPLLSSLV